MTTNEKLLRTLNHHGASMTTYGDSDLFHKVRKLHAEKPLKYTGEWLKSWRCNGSPILEKESTYRGCIDFEILSRNKIEFTLWDGDVLYGNKEDRRCTFIVTVPERIILPVLKEKITKLSYCLEERQEEKRREANRLKVESLLLEGCDIPDIS
jgi:hypothetical protein